MPTTDEAKPRRVLAEKIFSAYCRGRQGAEPESEYTIEQHLAHVLGAKSCGQPTPAPLVLRREFRSAWRSCWGPVSKSETGGQS